MLTPLPGCCGNFRLAVLQAADLCPVYSGSVGWHKYRLCLGLLALCRPGSLGFMPRCVQTACRVQAYWRGGSTKAQPSLAGVNRAVSKADLAAEDPEEGPAGSHLPVVTVPPKRTPWPQTMPQTCLCLQWWHASCCRLPRLLPIGVAVCWSLGACVACSWPAIM